jgi:hypothetical protein
MRARMTPTPVAPGRWRQVVCSCEGPRPCANVIEGYEAAVIGDVIAITVFAFTPSAPDHMPGPGADRRPRYWYRPMARPIIAHPNRQKRNARKGGIHHGHGS